MSDEIKLPVKQRILKSGAIYDYDAGRIVGHTGENYYITAENSRALNARKRQKAVASQLRGLAAKNGIALPADASDDQILNGALDAVEALTSHLKDTFLKSNNIRGLAEAYVKLTMPLIGQGDDDDDQNKQREKATQAIRELAAIARQVMASKDGNNGSDETIIDVE